MRPKIYSRFAQFFVLMCAFLFLSCRQISPLESNGNEDYLLKEIVCGTAVQVLDAAPCIVSEEGEWVKVLLTPLDEPERDQSYFGFGHRVRFVPYVNLGIEKKSLG
jgi:hypothetical protein